MSGRLLLRRTACYTCTAILRGSLAARGARAAGRAGAADMKVASRVPAKVLVATVLFAISLPAFYQQTLGTAKSDFPLHFGNVLTDTRSVTPYYSILWFLVTGLYWAGANYLTVGWIAIVLCSVCVALKGMLSFDILSNDSERLALPACIAIALAFVMPIVNWWNYKFVYLGQIAPTIWHNSTTILVMPVVILLFSASSRSLGAPSTRNAVLTSALCALSAIIKPNYAIALLPVLVPWYCCTAFTTGMSAQRVAGHVAIVIGPVMGVLLGQWLVLTSYTAFTIAPFGVWTLISPNPLASLMLSVAFPVAVSILYRERWRGNVAFILAWAVFAAALMEFILLAEEEWTGRFQAANFLWGAGIALYLVFLTCADAFFRQAMSIRFVLALTLFLAHLASGIYYFWRIVSGLGFR